MPDEINGFLKNAGFEILENYGAEYKNSDYHNHPWMNVFAIKK